MEVAVGDTMFERGSRDVVEEEENDEDEEEETVVVVDGGTISSNSPNAIPNSLI